MNGNSNKQCECQKKSHLRWIDAAKGVAIIAVIIDHSTGILFSNRIISLCLAISAFLDLCKLIKKLSKSRLDYNNS